LPLLFVALLPALQCREPCVYLRHEATVAGLAPLHHAEHTLLHRARRLKAVRVHECQAQIAHDIEVRLALELVRATADSVADEQRLREELLRLHHTLAVAPLDAHERLGVQRLCTGRGEGWVSLLR
jgi:hypothetical protein